MNLILNFCTHINTQTRTIEKIYFLRGCLDDLIVCLCVWVCARSPVQQYKPYPKIKKFQEGSRADVFHLFTVSQVNSVVNSISISVVHNLLKLQLSLYLSFGISLSFVRVISSFHFLHLNVCKFLNHILTVWVYDWQIENRITAQST